MKTKPYPPHPIHKVFAWIDRLRMPAWLFYVLLLLSIGGLIQFFAWEYGLVPRGEIDISYLFSFAWPIEGLALTHYALKNSSKILDAFREQLPLDDAKYQDLKYVFTIVPRGRSWFFFFIGSIVGLNSARLTIDESLTFPFSIMPFVQWGLSLGIGIMSVYLVVRQIRFMQQIFDLPEEIDLANLSPIYAFSGHMAIVAFGFFFIADINPLLLAPRNFDSTTNIIQSIFFVVFALIVFYLPLRGINQRISAEKEKLLRDVDLRLKRVFENLHAAEEAKKFQKAPDLREMIGALREEREIIQVVRTWPWRPGTFTALLSTLLLPLVISLLQSLVSNYLDF